MRFILSRVLALTVIVGLGALVLSLLFKVLIGATIIVAIVYAARRRFSRQQMGYQEYDHMNMQNYSDHPGPFGNSSSTTPFRAPWQKSSICTHSKRNNTY